MTASDNHIRSIAEHLFTILEEEFDSPRDAGAALMTSYFLLLTHAFGPEKVKHVMKCVDTDAKNIKQLLSEGWT